MKIGQDIHQFQEIADELLGKINSNKKQPLTIDLPELELQKIEAISMNTIAYAGKLVGGVAGGSAAAYAVYGGTMALAAASTGTPIAALSGVAAYNATMAAIGGGSLAAGGLGITGGPMILSGVVAAPVIAITGWAFASHAEDALEKARSIRQEVRDYTEQVNKSCAYLKNLTSYVEVITKNVDDIYGEFIYYLDDLKAVAELVKTDRLDIIEQDKAIHREIENGYTLASILADVMTIPIFKIKTSDGEIIYNENGSPVLQQEDGFNVLNDEQMQEVMDEAVIASKQYAS
ncbi:MULTISPECIES: chemotaxis protein [unclassified Moraxella]|uniref:chemotaxis protein n=1 Tax=unclassified Moraxella TaxID=2685852 RepID=UPI00359E422A